MEAPGSFEEWEVCFHTTCSEVTKLAASRCNVGPNRANCFQKTVHGSIQDHSLQREQLWSLALNAPNLWTSVGVCKG